MTFTAQLNGELRARLSADPTANETDVLTELILEQLEEQGETEDAQQATFQAGQMTVHGYGTSETGDRLDLMITVPSTSNEPLSEPEILRKITALRSFAERALNPTRPLSQLIEQNPGARDMALKIEQIAPQLSLIRLHLLTNAPQAAPVSVDAETIGTIRVQRFVWDAAKLEASFGNSRPPQTPVVDIEGMDVFLPCLVLPAQEQDYEACLTIIPGKVLAEIYKEHGARLLERNVRAYLQIAGGINKGIRRSILQEPRRFMAYNNGISATASHIEYGTRDGQLHIKAIHDLQIVNGGQTTASLHRAMTKDRADLSGIHVQMKISIVSQTLMEEMVPLIARYANSQNKIEEADLAANDTFHVELQRESRQTKFGSTFWYYERARGQYLGELAELSPGKRLKFTQLHPKDQKLTKVDIAKFANTWDGDLHHVNRGNQKSFTAFTLKLQEIGGAEVTTDTFRKLIGIALLFKSSNAAARRFLAYRANTTAFTVGLLAHWTDQQLNITQLSELPQLPEELSDVIRATQEQVHALMLRLAGSSNVTEWCKKPLAWTAMKELRPSTAHEEILRRWRGNPQHILIPLPPSDAPEADQDDE